MTTTANQVLKQIDGVYHVPVFANGRKKWISTGSSSKAEAQRVLAESGVERLNTLAKAGRLSSKAIGQILTGKNLTCAKALEEYSRISAARKSAKTILNHKIVIENWLKDMKIESLPPSSIEPHHIAKWINDPDSEWKRSTRAVALSSVRAFFAFCSHKGWVVSDPSQMVALDYSVMTHEQKESGDKQPFTNDEVSQLLRELKHDLVLFKREGHNEHAKPGKHLFGSPDVVLFWLVAVTVCKETGLRLSDIAQLEWRSFETAGKLVVWTEKTNKRIEHNISDGLQNLIGEVPVGDARYIFPEQRNIIRDTSKRAGLSVQFGRLCERVGIEGRSFHSLRHYKATHAFASMDKNALAKKLAESLSMDQIATLLGHGSSKVTKGYVH